MEPVIKPGMGMNDFLLLGSWHCSCNLIEALQVHMLSFSFIIISDSFRSWANHLILAGLFLL